MQTCQRTKELVGRPEETGRPVGHALLPVSASISS